MAAGTAAGPVERGRRPAHPREGLLDLHRRYGNRRVRGMIQAKLEVGAVDDPLERAADRVALLVTGASLQYAPAVAGGAPVPGGGDAGPGVAQAVGRMRGQGRPVPERIRRRMETASGADLGGVRVHVGGESDRLNDTLGARAFTVGSDVFVRRSEYTPGTATGDALLAHELVHSLQQGAAGPASHRDGGHPHTGRPQVGDTAAAEGMRAVRATATPIAQRNPGRKQQKSSESTSAKKRQKRHPGSFATDPSQTHLSAYIHGLIRVPEGDENTPCDDIEGDKELDKLRKDICGNETKCRKATDNIYRHFGQTVAELAVCKDNGGGEPTTEYYVAGQSDLDGDQQRKAGERSLKVVTKGGGVHAEVKAILQANEDARRRRWALRPLALYTTNGACTDCIEWLPKVKAEIVKDYTGEKGAHRGWKWPAGSRFPMELPGG